MPTNWWHICIFADTRSQTKNAKEPPANTPRQSKMNGQTTNRQEGRTDNKQIGKRAGEQLRLNDSAKLNDSNSIQHLC